MQAITRISVFTSLALLVSAALSATTATACPYGGYVRTYSYYTAPAYGYNYGYGSYGYGHFPKSTIVKPINPGITPAPATPGPADTPAPSAAPTPAPGPTSAAAPINPAPVNPAPAINPNNTQLEAAAPVAANNPPVNPNQSQARFAAP